MHTGAGYNQEWWRSENGHAVQNLSNTSLGQYHLIELIGRGRLSMVYKAHQPSLQRLVAIKVLQHLDLLGATRFEREAQLIAQLHHPNILPIFDYGQQDGLRYFVMQYVEQSCTLSDVLAHKPIEQIAALRMMQHLLAGLGYAHSRGIIHRDIKPSNILLPAPTWPLLADFGIAKLLDDLRQLTPPGHAVGTADYMAPELARGLPADPRSDLYSVGIVLYELLTGQVPFDAVTPAAVLNMHIHAAPPPPRSLNQELPLAVETLLLRALEKDQAARYQSAADMADAVAHVVSQLEREQILAAMLSPAALSSASPSYITRKLDSDSRSAEMPAQQPEAAYGAQHEPSRSGSVPTTPRPSASRLRPSWSLGLTLMITVALSLLGGMLAGYVALLRTGEDGPGPPPTQTIQSSTPITLQERSMIGLPTVFPTAEPGSARAPALPASTMPALLELPSKEVPTQPPIETAESSPPTQPIFQPPTQPLVETFPPSAVP
jgi:serine/threonine protein kinase